VHLVGPSHMCTERSTVLRM